MSGDLRDPDSWDESEFGLGEGMIDPTMRVDGRDALPVHQQQWEIMAMPRSFDGSAGERPDASETPVPRLLPGEEASDR